MADAIDGLPQSHEVWRNVALGNNTAALPRSSAAPTWIQLVGEWRDLVGALKLIAGGVIPDPHVDSQRGVRYGSLNQALTAGYRGATTRLFTEIGYALPLSDTATIEPFVGLTWSQLRMRGFSDFWRLRFPDRRRVAPA